MQNAAGEGGNPAIGTGKAEHHQIGMNLLQRSPLLARLTTLCLQPSRQLVGKRIKLDDCIVLAIFLGFIIPSAVG